MFHFKIKLTMCNKTFSIFNGFSEFHLKRLSQKIPKSVMVVLRKLWWFLLSRKKIFFIFTDTFLKLKASFDKKCDLYRNREFNFLKMFRILSYKWLLFHDDISRVVTLENSVPNNNFVNWKKKYLLLFWKRNAIWFLSIMFQMNLEFTHCNDTFLFVYGLKIILSEI